MLYAFVDESGDNGLDFSKEGTSKFFVVTAVLVKQEDLSDFEAKIDERIKKRHFQGSEIKSSNIGNEDHRRLRALADLLDAPFRVYSLVIDKRRLNRDSGLQYKGSFYKNLHGRVDTELYRRFPDLQIMADEHDTRDFMEGFKRYIDRKHPLELFRDDQFQFVDSVSSLGVQTADLVGGSIAKFFERSLRSGGESDFVGALGEKVLAVSIWPPPKFPFDRSPEEYAESPHDALIVEQALRMAEEYINKNRESDEATVRDRVATVQYLGFCFEMDPRRYVYNEELREQLNAFRAEPMGHDAFMLSVIGKLRDEFLNRGVLDTLLDARVLTAQWRQEYNQRRDDFRNRPSPMMSCASY